MIAEDEKIITKQVSSIEEELDYIKNQISDNTEKNKIYEGHLLQQKDKHGILIQSHRKTV